MNRVCPKRTPFHGIGNLMNRVVPQENDPTVGFGIPQFPLEKVLSEITLFLMNQLVHLTVGFENPPLRRTSPTDKLLTV